MPKTTAVAPQRGQAMESDANGKAARPSQDEAPMPVNPFTRASRKHEEPGHDATTAIGSSSVQAGPFDVPSYGFLRNEVIHVETDGTGAGGSAVAEADAPWSALGEVALSDADGAPLVGPVSGYELYLINKYGGIVPPPLADPRLWDAFSAIDANGEFAFDLRVPVEVSARDGFCALPNMNTSQQFKLGFNITAEGTIYSTAPVTTTPGIRHRTTLEAWAPVEAADLRGFPNQQEPPGRGSAQYWTRHIKQISAGENSILLPRLGNWLRNLVFIFRDSTGARVTSTFPDSLRLEWDGALVWQRRRSYWRQLMREQYGLDAAEGSANGPDVGVFVENFTHDFDGHAGQEMRDQYLPTTKGARIELKGSFGEAGTLTILTNDVVPRSVEAVYGA